MAKYLKGGEMKWTKTDRANTCINVLNSFFIEYKAIVDFAKKGGVDHNELWLGYCEQRKEVMANNLIKARPVKKEEKMKNKGLSIHCHHNSLLEYCYDYDERVRVIKKEKPQNEQEIRLRLFKILPQEAIDDLPEKIVKACAEWKKAYAEWKKADQETWHKKWCGCTYWKNGSIDFNK